jgi:hypothetical protein
MEVMTRDGIPLLTSISVTFRVRRPPGAPEIPPSGAPPYPYDPDTIFRLTYADGIAGNRGVSWDNRICPQARALLVGEIAACRLDELYPPPVFAAEGSATYASPEQIADEVKRQLQKQLLAMFECTRDEECPVELLRVSVGRLQPPPDVAEQRIDNWQSAWKRRIAFHEIESRVKEIRERQQV